MHHRPWSAGFLAASGNRPAWLAGLSLSAHLPELQASATAAGCCRGRSGARGFSLGGAVEAGQVAGGGGVLRGFVVAPSPGEPGEPHRQPGLLLDLPPAGGVVRREGQLSAEDLQHEPGLEPHRSEERRVGKSVDLGGRRIIKKKNKQNETDRPRYDTVFDTRPALALYRTYA